MASLLPLHFPISPHPPSSAFLPHLLARLTSLRPSPRNKFSSPTKTSTLAPVRMRLKAVESFDGSFELKPECEEKLRSLLNSESFKNQVSQQMAQQPDSTHGLTYEFTGELFKPVPWSIHTKHGMPQEFEKYMHDKDFAIINVPPNFMFQANIFNPSKLCAVFKRLKQQTPPLSTAES